jgi:hypothetical protein
MRSCWICSADTALIAGVAPIYIHTPRSGAADRSRLEHSAKHERRSKTPCGEQGASGGGGKVGLASRLSFACKDRCRTDCRRVSGTDCRRVSGTDCCRVSGAVVGLPRQSRSESSRCEIAQCTCTEPSLQGRGTAAVCQVGKLTAKMKKLIDIHTANSQRDCCLATVRHRVPVHICLIYDSGGSTCTGGAGHAG